MKIKRSKQIKKESIELQVKEYIFNKCINNIKNKCNTVDELDIKIDILSNHTNEIKEEIESGVEEIKSYLDEIVEQITEEFEILIENEN